MALFCLAVLSVLAVAAPAVRSENQTAFQALSDCNSLCRDTFPQHTYEQSSHVVSCQRGCRLHALAGYSKRGPQDLTTAKDECQASCKEAYDDAGNQSACLAGCSVKESSAKERQQQFDDYERAEEQLALSFLSLSALMNNLMLPMMNSLDLLIPGSVVVEKELTAVDYSDDSVGVIVVISGKTSGILQTVDSQGAALRTEAEARTEQLAVGGQSETDCSWSSFFDTSNWNMNVDLNGWSQLVLSALLMLSIIGVLWMCCSTVATSTKSSPRRELKLKELEHLQEMQIQLLAYQQPQFIVDSMELPKKTAI